MAVEFCALADRACEPCRGGVPPMQRAQAETLLAELEESWRLNEQGHLFRRFEFPDFAQAWSLLNRCAELAEAAGHHPDLKLSWGALEVEIWTHKIEGLAEADFVLAAKIDRAAG